MARKSEKYSTDWLQKDQKEFTAEDWKEAFDLALEMAKESHVEPPVEYITYSEYLRRINAEKV